MRLRFGFGTTGCGATMSLCSSVQNGLIRSYKYHFRSSSSPFGSILGGRREGSGFQSSLTRERAVSDKYSARGRVSELEVVELFDRNNLFEMGSKKRRPVTCGDYLSLLCCHKLGMIAHSRLVDVVCYVYHTAHRCVLKKMLEQPKAPIGAELCMSHYQERVSHVCMLPSHYPPHQVLDVEGNHAVGGPYASPP